MLKVTKNLLLDNSIRIAILITVLIAYLSLIKVPTGVSSSFFNFKNGDKIQHLIAYTFLGLSWFTAFRNKKEKSIVKYSIICSCIFYGIILEVCQSILTSYRTADFRDIIANSIGVLLALLIFNFVSNKKQNI